MPRSDRPERGYESWRCAHTGSAVRPASAPPCRQATRSWLIPAYVAVARQLVRTAGGWIHDDVLDGVVVNRSFLELARLLGQAEESEHAAQVALERADHQAAGD